MPAYSNELINEISSRNDIIEYVSMYVQLKRSGRDYSGLCPFHHEKSPSFHVNREKQLFHCFGCGASGNLIQFVMRSESLDFSDALRVLADRAGIIIPENDNSLYDRNHERRKKFWEMNKLAARFFYMNLVQSDKDSDVVSYITKRGLSSATIKKYGIGYAQNSYDSLLKHLTSNGYTVEDIVENSLAVSREDKVYDKFRDRLMFPIIDVRGNIIGFGGRIINDNYSGDYKPPKYLNSGETIAFDKGRNLFSLNFAKNTDSRQLILCEGYMDVISVFQAGVQNIVATLGTAITSEQAKLMKRYADEIIICYDMDEAGRTAVLRAIDIINSVGGKSKVMKLRGAKDPDEYIKKNGVGAFSEEVKRAIGSTEYKISLVKIDNDTSDTEGKIKYVSEAVKTLEGVSNAAEVDAYIGQISNETGIGKDAIYAEYKKNIKKSATSNRSIIQMTIRSEGSTRNNISNNSVEYSAQRRLITIMLRDKHIALENEGKIEQYASVVLQKLAEGIIDCWKSGNIPDAASLVNMFSDNIDEQNEASAVFYSNEAYSDSEAAAGELVSSIKLNDIKKQIAEATKNGDIARVGELVKKLAEIKNNSFDNDEI